MENTIIEGQLEIDHNRGVIYFHCNPDYARERGVVTMIRVCGLATPVPKHRMLDLTNPTCDWRGHETS